MILTNSQLQWSFGVIALLLVAAGHAVEAGSSARKLSQLATLPSVKAMAAANMCGTECTGCAFDQGVARLDHTHPLGVKWVALENAVGLNNTRPDYGNKGAIGTLAHWPEECALINFNAVIRLAFEDPSVKGITGNGCTFRGFRTWGDVAALWSTPGNTAFEPSMLMTSRGIQVMLALAVDKQAQWVASQSCAVQAQPFTQFVQSLTAFPRSAVFANTSIGAIPKDVGCVFPEPTAVCLDAFKLGTQGFPAVTCDCSKLNPVFAPNAGKCKGQSPQAVLNGLLNYAGMMRPTDKVRLGSPMIASCAA
ncbi:hypothetical protein OEZ86_004391 [Tetradesmus obliquus]|nr:hypothetical protein OEZ86_004391 [Tetradesmus obliquus]